jgi:hypothetical protein
VPTTAACGERLGDLLADGALLTRLGQNGGRHVTNHFLITRYLADVLQLLRRVVAVQVGA